MNEQEEKTETLNGSDVDTVVNCAVIGQGEAGFTEHIIKGGYAALMPLMLAADAMYGNHHDPLKKHRLKSKLVRKCPECGKRHRNKKSLSCSAECFKKRYRK